jgi:O-antigen ligase
MTNQTYSHIDNKKIQYLDCFYAIVVFLYFIVQPFIALLLGIYGLAILSLVKKKIYLNKAYIYALLCFFILFLESCMHVMFKGYNETTVRIIFFLCSYIMLISLLLFYNPGRMPQYISAIWCLLVWLSFIFAFLGFKYGFYITPNQITDNLSFTYSIVSVFYNPNGYGQFLAFASVILLYGSMINKGILSILYSLTIGLSAIVVIGTYSRSSFLVIAFIATICLIYFIKNETFISVLKKAIGIFIALMSGWILILKEEKSFQIIRRMLLIFYEKIHFYGIDASALIRKELFVSGFDLWSVNPFWGIGPGAFENKIVQGFYNTGGITNPHSLLVEILTEYGIIGFMPLFIFMLFIFTKAFQEIIRKKPSNAKKRSAYVLILGIIAFIFLSFINSRNLIGFPVGLYFLSLISIYNDMKAAQDSKINLAFLAIAK